MHFLVLLFIALFATFAAAKDVKGCKSESCKKYAALIESSVDTCADPCDDFSAYVCGNFGKTHKIAPGRSSTSTIEDMINGIKTTLKSLLESQSLIDENLPQTKAAIYYRSCLNTTQRNILSKKPILDFVNEINRERGYMNKLRKLISTGMTGRILSFSADQDSKNPEYYILNIGKSALILSQATLKASEEPEEKKEINSYKKYMNTVLDLLGMWKSDRSMVDKIVDLNIRIAKFLPSMVDQSDPEKSYNKVMLGDLEKRCPELSLKKLINELLDGTGKQLCSSDDVVISSLEYFDKVCKLITTDNSVKEVLEMDLVWAAISSVIEFSSEEFVHAQDVLNEETMGVVGKNDLWKICVQDTSDTLVDAVGNMFVKENFREEQKKDAEDILLNIRGALRDVLNDITWMDAKTKEIALLKLKSIKQKIGYPESILNETDLMKNHAMIKIDMGKYAENHLQCKAATFINSMMGIGEKSPVDKWFMGPQELNAYYNPTTNEIVFPAAIFRFPLYDIDLPVTSKYGGIGLFIGHEILHGFDTSGSKFDDKGLMREWWTEETRSEYTKKAQCIINQYGNYTIYEKKLLSEQTIGEDIADNAGIRMAFKGSQTSKDHSYTIPGLDFTPEQLFFVNQAMTWCSVVTKESILDSLKTDEHTIGKFRINGPLSNMPEFSKAFNCQHDQKMNRHKKCLVF